MTKKDSKRDAVEILKNRYVKGDAKRVASLETERVNAQVARMIYDIRKDAGLTQGELAEMVGTTQSVISRLEDADYDGHSLSMLNRIADALRQKLTVRMTAPDPETGPLRFAFHMVLQFKRRERGLSISTVAERADIDKDELWAMEQREACRPNPLTLHKLSRFYDIPERQMLVLAGAVSEVPDEFMEKASRFAAMSTESFAKLSKDEKKVLDEFMRYLKSVT
jgi:transcriptional regulator with XRE-family HTH domain